MAERTIDLEVERAHAIPAAAGPLIGRDADLQYLTALLRDRHARLVTLTGPGGVGKTQLAIHASQACAREYPDGAIFLSLAQARSSETVLTMIASGLSANGVGETGHRHPLEQILRSIQGRRILLILDNLEQVADCVLILSSILTSAPELTILVTSRETLRISGERVFAVAPLDLPRASRLRPLSVAETMESPAIQLFLTRALGPSLVPSEGDPYRALSPALGGMLTRVCRALDGIPLAIELVAARIRADTVTELEQQLTETLRDRPSSYVAHDPLSHGMRQAVQWSYDLLTPEEQRFFERFSVFAGGCPFDAVPAVVPDLTEDTAVVLASSLIDKSLLSTQIDPAHLTRIIMLEPLRDFARDRLAQRGDDRMMHERHAQWCLTLAERALVLEDRGRGSPHLRSTLEAEIDNLRTARDWAAATGHYEFLAQLCDALGEFWHTSGRIREGYEWLLRVHHARADRTLAPERQMRLALRTAITARHVGDLETAAETYERARELAKALEHHAVIVAAMTGLGLIAEMRGDEPAALAHFRDALIQQRELGDPGGLVMPLVNLGDAEFRNGDVEASRMHSVEARTIADRIGNRLMGCLARGNLGQLALAGNDPDAAWRIYDEALAIARETQDGFLIADAVGGMVGVAVSRGEYPLACSLLGATQGLCERFGGVSIPHFGQLEHSRNVLASKHSPEDRDRLIAEGTTWTLKDALRAISLIGPDQPPQSSRPRRSVLREPSALTSVSLTKREAEVLHLTAQGYSDRDIAEMLSLSHRTISGHVGTACKKFQVRTRLEATVLAQRMGLISVMPKGEASD